MSTRNCRSTRASAEVVVVTVAVEETAEVDLEAVAVEAAIGARSETMPRVDVGTISVEMAMIAGRSLAAGMTTVEVLERRVVVWTVDLNRVARLAPVVAAIVDSGLEEPRDWEGLAVATAAASAL
uniref:(northern house mosquito) hypothetical protein n=1 Tax=Culex pipiens TaxID=7175 RepID=A0A8D8D9M8_CULPI